MKVAFLTNVVSPYRAPMLQSLAATDGWRLSVIVNAVTEFDRRWDGRCDGVDVIASRTLQVRRRHVSRHPVRSEQLVTTHLPLGLWRDLSRVDPDVVITHELGPRSLLAATWCRAKRRPYVLWSYQSRAMGSAGGLLRRVVRRRLLRSAAAIVGMGRQARDVLEAAQVPASRIIDAPNATDLRLLRGRLALLQQDGTVAALRRAHGDGRRIAVVPGRLVAFKGVLELLRLWRELPASTRAAWRLVFVGDGPLRAAMDALVAGDDGVAIAEGVPMADIPAWFAMADLHIFASLADAWGLTVQEAMLCGTPTLCSVHAGCADDLVRDGIDGLLWDPARPDQALPALRAALERDDLEQLGAAAVAHAAEYTPERLAAAFVEAVGRAMSSSARGDRSWQGAVAT